MTTLSKDVALNEFEKWFNYKKLPEYLREDKREDENQIICAFMDGRLTMTEEFELKQTLLFPVNDSLDVLTFQPRLKVVDLQKVDKATSQGVGSIVKLGEALTGEPGGLIRNLDSVDFSLTKSICTYFLF
jgi:hypothetical protein